MRWPGRIFIEGYRRLLTHPRFGGWVLLASFAYLISPIDLSPDLVPILGQIDDVALIFVMVSAFTQWATQRMAPSPEAEGSQPNTTAPEGQTVDVKAVTLDPES
ncbi:YkvA family protein [Leptolyngbya sp. PCC 6406]|uniref:YkvA family protein n=1 Tax=Leptolyngbya sp. PCC 6406 TaxID=1173264 RepID=UPI0002ACB04F|nr:YkvA family protein [Leptolyngbya sp. PCC 6406]